MNNKFLQQCIALSVLCCIVLAFILIINVEEAESFIIWFIIWLLNRVIDAVEALWDWFSDIINSIPAIVQSISRCATAVSACMSAVQEVYDALQIAEDDPTLSNVSAVSAKIAVAYNTCGDVWGECFPDD